jgi:predicted RNase H-like HicB family nuclease
MFNLFKKSDSKMPHQIRYEYQIPDKITLNIKQDEKGWYVIKAKELPGFLTQAKNNREINKVINDAILTYFDVPAEEFNGQLGGVSEFETEKQFKFA